MVSLFINQKDGVEDLHDLMGIQGGAYPGDPVQVTVYEFAKPAVIIDRSGPGPAAHVKLEAGDTKGVLHVDRYQAGPEGVFIGRGNIVFFGPGSSLFGPVQIRNLPHLPGFRRVKVRR
jgi:hypothetical protein